MLNQLRKRRDQGGFTLIELLIVIIILGILAAVVVLSINAIRDRGAESACETEAEQIRVALAGEYSDTGAYPGSTWATDIRDFLDNDPSGNWTYATSATGYTLTGITGGDCDGIVVTESTGI